MMHTKYKESRIGNFLNTSYILHQTVFVGWTYLGKIVQMTKWVQSLTKEKLMLPITYANVFAFVFLLRTFVIFNKQNCVFNRWMAETKANWKCTSKIFKKCRYKQITFICDVHFFSALKFGSADLNFMTPIIHVRSFCALLAIVTSDAKKGCSTLNIILSYL